MNSAQLFATLILVLCGAGGLAPASTNGSPEPGHTGMAPSSLADAVALASDAGVSNSQWMMLSCGAHSKESGDHGAVRCVSVVVSTDTPTAPAGARCVLGSTTPVKESVVGVLNRLDRLAQHVGATPGRRVLIDIDASRARSAGPTNSSDAQLHLQCDLPSVRRLTS